MAKSKKASKASKLRRSSKFRIILLIVLLAILVAMYFTMEKFRIWIIAMGVLVMVALGFEIGGTDLDLGKLIETGSIKESVINKTEAGTWIFGGDCAKEQFNCSSFKYQQEAQELYAECANGSDEDPHGLDRDKDGIVCEGLPNRPALVE